MSGPQPIPIPEEWKQPIATWDQWMTTRGLTEQTRYSWRHKVSHFARTCRQPPADVTSAELIAFLSRNTQRNTLRADHSALSSFYRYLLQTGTISKNPMDAVPLSKRKNTKMPPAPASAVEKAEKTADQKARLMILLMARMGLRRSEVAGIAAKDITDSRSGMTLTIHGKGDKDRRIPVDPEIVGLVRSVRPESGWLFPSMNHSVSSGRHITPGQVGRIVKQKTGYAAHSFRRRFATDLWQATGDVMIVKQILGHESLATTQTYIWTTEEEMRQALAILDRQRTHPARHDRRDPIMILEGYGIPATTAEDIIRAIRSE